jgi:hypothetical protein
MYESFFNKAFTFEGMLCKQTCFLQTEAQATLQTNQVLKACSNSADGEQLSLSSQSFLLAHDLFFSRLSPL